MYFKFVNSHDDYCHNIIFYSYIFEKIKKDQKYVFDMFWSTFGYFIIFYHLFFSHIYNFFKKIIKNKKNQTKVLEFFLKERTHFIFKNWISQKPKKEEYIFFYKENFRKH